MKIRRNRSAAPNVGWRILAAILVALEKLEEE